MKEQVEAEEIAFSVANCSMQSPDTAELIGHSIAETLCSQ